MEQHGLIDKPCPVKCGVRIVEIIKGGVSDQDNSEVLVLWMMYLLGFNPEEMGIDLLNASGEMREAVCILYGCPDKQSNAAICSLGEGPKTNSGDTTPNSERSSGEAGSEGGFAILPLILIVLAAAFAIAALVTGDTLGLTSFALPRVSPADSLYALCAMPIYTIIHDFPGLAGVFFYGAVVFARHDEEYTAEVREANLSVHHAFSLKKIGNGLEERPIPAKEVFMFMRCRSARGEPIAYMIVYPADKGSTCLRWGARNRRGLKIPEAFLGFIDKTIKKYDPSVQEDKCFKSARFAQIHAAWAPAIFQQELGLCEGKILPAFIKTKARLDAFGEIKAGAIEEALKESGLPLWYRATHYYCYMRLKQQGLDLDRRFKELLDGGCLPLGAFLQILRQAQEIGLPAQKINPGILQGILNDFGYGLGCISAHLELSNILSGEGIDIAARSLENATTSTRFRAMYGCIPLRLTMSSSGGAAMMGLRVFSRARRSLASDWRSSLITSTSVSRA
jgi:hypothetical protein